MRDNLNKQIFFATLYRKTIIWTDLAIPPDEWGPQKVVDAINKINEF